MIYLDNNATTSTDKRVVEEMLPYFTKVYANPASQHTEGKKVKRAIDRARSQVCELIGCDSKELIFTSGATEAINLGIKGIAYANRNKGNHIITVTTEHKAVLDTCEFLESQGFEVTYLPVKSNGSIDLKHFHAAFREDTILCTAMYANNETGVIHPINKLVEATHQNNALFFCDATQVVGKIPIDVNRLGIDLLAFSGHKFYGPKGVGILFRQKGIDLQSQIHGGGHEGNLRSGTLNVPLIVGLGRTCQLANQEMINNQRKISRIKNIFEEEVLKIQGTRINGFENDRLFNVSNIHFKDIEADMLIAHLRNIMVSTGSACTSALIQPSHVLLAMGMTEKEAYSCIRFSFGKDNELEEIYAVLDKINTSVENLRKLVN